MIRQSQRFLTQMYALVDFLIIGIAFLVAWWIKFRSGWLDFESPLPFSSYFQWGLIYGLTAVAVGSFLGFYSPKRKKRFSFEVFKIAQVHGINMLLLLSILFFVKEINISREFLGIFLFSNIVAITIYRYIVKMGLKMARKNGYNKQFILIIGAGTLGKRFYHNLDHYPELGYEVIGFIDDNKHADVDERPILGGLDDLHEVLKERLVDEVIIALPLDVHHKIGSLIRDCEKAGVKTMIIPDYYDYLPARPQFLNFAGIPLINVRDVPLDELRNLFIKRSFDIVFSIVAIVLTLPVMLCIAIGIKLTSKGPIIYKQERIGKSRRPFMMYKFRSMKYVSGAADDHGWTTKDDPRRTAFGMFIRRTSLDELPQFFNVLKGDMSVVGPRPERPYYVDQFKEDIPKYMIKHHIRPGITGWAQSNGLRGDTSIEDRIKYDIFYIENWTFLLDIKIIIKTILNGFTNKNAY